MVAWKRYPIPEFDHQQYQDMQWSAPALQDAASVGSGAGATAVSLDSDVANRFSLSGEHLHAVVCNVPAAGAHMLGRSHAWKIQRMLLINAGNGEVVADWKTPRPINTRLGPDDGIDLPGGAYLVVCGYKYADELDDFDHVCLTFSWKA